MFLKFKGFLFPHRLNDSFSLSLSCLFVSFSDSIRGDFRTTVEYLITLLEKEEFCRNAIHTGWLDSLIRDKVGILLSGQYSFWRWTYFSFVFFIVS